MITHSTAFEGRKLSSPIADIWSEVPRTLDEVAVPHSAITVYFEPEKNGALWRRLIQSMSR